MKKLDKEILSYLKWCADKFLSFRPRSENELVRYLQQKVKKRHPEILEEQDDYINEIISQFKEANGINDGEFVGWWVTERSYFKPRSERVLRLELKQKGVSSELVDEYFAAHPPKNTSLLKQLIQKKAFVIDFSSDKNIEKLTQHLLRRGFSYSEIKKAIEEYRNSV